MHNRTNETAYYLFQLKTLLNKTKTCKVMHVVKSRLQKT